MGTTFTESHRPTKKRGRSKSLTKHEVEAARNRLRDAAAAGDVQACAALIALAENQHHPKAVAAA